jgi:very-short-patch-repair endonuclease
MTFPESLLWSRLRGGCLDHAKFRRQHVIGRYVADFYCPECRLVVEVDGMSHQHTSDADAERQRWMERQGYRVVRVMNDDVLNSMDAVLELIHRELQVHRETMRADMERSRATSDTNPSPGRERAG